MSDRIDISEETKAICAKLGLTYKRVRRLVILPRDVLVEVDHFPDGRKRIDPVTGELVVERLEFEVST